MPNNLQLILTVDNRPGNQAIGQFNQALSSIEKSAASASRSASASISSIDQTAVRAVASIKQSFGGLGQVFAGIGIAALGQQIISIAANFESARIGIKALTGDAVVAQQLFDKIQAFALKSPFEFEDLQIGAQRLLAFNFEAQKIVPTLTAISAGVGALGGDSGKFNDAITALGQIRTAAKLTGEELRQLRNLGLEGVALDSLAKAFGKTRTEIKKMQEGGLIPGLQAADIIIDGITTRFGKFNDEVSKTAKTGFSNFRDAMKKLADEVGGVFLPSITNALNKDLLPALQGLGAWAKENNELVKNIGVAIGGIGIAIVTYKVVTGLYAVATALGAVSVAALANPYTILAAGAAALFYQLHKQNQEVERWISLQDKLKKPEDPFTFKPQDVAGFGIKVNQIVPGVTDEAAAKKRESAEKRAAEMLRKAQLDELTGVFKIIEEYRDYRKELGLSKKANEDLAAAVTLRIRSEGPKQWEEFVKENVKQLQEQNKAATQIRNDNFQKDIELSQQVLEAQLGNSRERFAQEDIFHAASRDSQLQQLEAVNAVTIEQKMAVEIQKADIEQDYLRKSLQVKRDLLNIDEQIELAKAANNADLRLAIEAKYELARRALGLETDAALQAAKEGGAIRAADIQISEQRRAFEDAKASVESLFDAMMNGARSFWDAFKRLFFTAALAPIKEAFSNFLAGILTGQRSSSGGAGGILSGIAGIGGLRLGGIGSAGAPGGTGGFAGPVGGIASTGGGFGSAFGALNAGTLGLGGAALGLMGAFKAGQSGNKFLKASAPAIGAVSGLLGFGALSYLFPSLIAAGPIGWIAAAGIGATIGIVAILKKSAEQKIVEKVKSLYGITINSGFAKDPLAGIIKQSFGGNIDVGIRSPQVRDLIELYAMSTGQNPAGGFSYANRQPMSLQQRGGTIYQTSPSFSGYSSPGTSLSGRGQAAPIVIQSVVLQVNGQSAADLVDGRAAAVIQSNPRAIQSAVHSAQRGNFGRKETLSQGLSPTLLTTV